MNCLTAEDILLAVSRRDLSEETRRHVARINAHTRTCAACRERLAAAEILYTVFESKERTMESAALRQELETSMTMLQQLELSRNYERGL